jgi:hypothetical protein
MRAVSLAVAFGVMRVRVSVVAVLVRERVKETAALVIGQLIAGRGHEDLLGGCEVSSMVARKNRADH